jgi:hypothetical protein
VLRAIVLAAVPALLMSVAAPPSFAGDKDTKEQVTTPAQKKPAMRSRGFHPVRPSAEEAAPGAVPPASSPSGDGGGAEDTIGGLPGHSSGPGLDKQP